MSKIIYHTFERWDELGFYVMKGEKSKVRNSIGKPLFSRNQVDEKYKEDCSIDLADFCD